MDNDYTRSQFRCPLCGEVIGCEDQGETIICSRDLLLEHVNVCRKRVKPEHSSKYGSRG